MYIKRKLFLPLVLICSFLVGSTCFASGRGVSPALYGDNAYNSEVIREFNNYSAIEQANLLKDLFPLMMQRLGFKMNDSYSSLNNVYQLKKAIKSQNGTLSANDYFNNSTDSIDEKLYFVFRDEDNNYNWYNELSNYLVNVVSVSNDNIVLNDTSGLYYVSNDYIDNVGSYMGLVDVELLSYKNINSSVFSNITQYNEFITWCNTQKNNGYHFIVFWRGQYNNFSFASESCMHQALAFNNLYSDGVVADGHLCSINSDGSNNQIMTIGYARQGSTAHFLTNSSTVNTQMTLGRVGSSTIGSFASTLYFGASNGPYYVFTLEDSKTVYHLYTSRNAWIDSQGHFEYPFEITSYYNNVPNTIISSRDMTSVYNQIYTDNSINDSNNVTNIYYPNSFTSDSNTYDEDTHILDFSGVGALLASIGNLIGSLINGIAQGIANIVSSVSSVVANFTNNIINGSLLGFLKSIFSWLPEPIPSLIVAIFTLSVLFGLIKLVKGIF